MKKRRGSRGFTLLELLIVVAIIGILASIAIPNYNAYRLKVERKAIVSLCRELYRGFVVYYFSWMEYPLASVAAPGKPPVFNLTNLEPIAESEYMDVRLTIEAKPFLTYFVGNKAEKYDSPDDMGDNQEFYVILNWNKDPNVKFVIASADNITDADGNLIDGGNWIDGIVIVDDGEIVGY